MSKASEQKPQTKPGKKRGPKSKITDAQIIHGLEKEFGNITVTAKRLGISRGVLSNRIHGNPKLKYAAIECRESRADYYRRMLDHFALNKDMPSLKAVMFFLKHYDKEVIRSKDDLRAELPDRKITIKFIKSDHDRDSDRDRDTDD